MELPFNNPDLNRSLLVSSVSFSAVDITAAGIKAAARNRGNKYGFAKDFLLGINCIGVFRLGQTGINEAFPPERLEKLYDNFSLISERVKENEVVASISDMPLGVVPATIKVVKTCKESVSEYVEAKEECIRIQRECESNYEIRRIFNSG